MTSDCPLPSCSGPYKGPSRYGGLKVHRLVDVLRLVPLPPNCPLSGVSSKWRCVIAPRVDDEEAANALAFFERGIPCRLSRDRATEVRRSCGPDAFAFICNPKWSSFPKPKIAFRAGWAGPGTEMESEAYHQLIGSFHEVFDHAHAQQRGPSSASNAEVSESKATESHDEDGDGEREVPPQDILNLQMFHRSDPNVDPMMPVLAELLQWPSALEDGAICDNATRVSQRGAVTWWHLDDSGEFVLQTALPLTQRQPLSQRTGGESCSAETPSLLLERTPPIATTEDGSIPSNDADERLLFEELYDTELDAASCLPTKLFIYGPPGSYDWFMHDDETDTSGKIAALNIFRTPDCFLPVDDSVLPILTVAVLESGGRPLISPPNIPHAVVSVNDCVMVEQRRVCNLFLDEVAYFLEKCSLWQGSPILYSYVTDQLQHEAVLRDEIIPTLVHLFNEHVDSLAPYDQSMCRRAAASLFALSSFPQHFSLSEDPRRSLEVLVRDRLSTTLDAVLPGEPSPAWTLRSYLLDHWAVKHKFWPKPGCVFAPPRNLFSASPCNPLAHTFLPVVYWKGSPIFGCEKETVEKTAVEYHHLVRLIMLDSKDPQQQHHTLPRAVCKYLEATKKPPASRNDELMDELF